MSCIIGFPILGLSPFVYEGIFMICKSCSLKISNKAVQQPIAYTNKTKNL